MELRVLKYFLAVAEEKGYTPAANRLHVTQPTLSRQIAEMEQELGTTLFVRGKRGRALELTEDGELLRRRAEEIVALATRTETAFTRDREHIAGTVTIGAGETPNVRILADAAVSVKNAHPDVDFITFSGNAADVTEKLDAGLIDFGLLLGASIPRRYDSLVFPVSDVWGLLMRQDCPLAEKDTITPKDLKGIPLIASMQSSATGVLSGWLGYRASELNVVARYNLLFNASIMVKAGMGSAICLEGIVEPNPSNGLIFRPLEPALTQNMLLTWKKNAPLSRAAQAFLDEVKNIVRQ